MKKAALVFGVLLLMAFTFLVGYGRQGYQTLVVKPKWAVLPEFTMVPTLLDIKTLTPSATATSLTYYGYTVTMPWGDILSTTNGQSFSIVEFEDGPRVCFYNPDLWIDAFDEIVGGTDVGSQVLRKVFAGYDHKQFYEEYLNAHPSQFHIFMSKERCNRLTALLLLKSMAVASYSTVHQFELEVIGGYQLGQPGEDTMVHLAIFHDDDDPYELMVSTRKGEENRLTQDDVNLIISSFQLSN